MKFQVVWQELVYDQFDDLKEVNDKPLFDIKVDSFEKARESAERGATNKIITRRQLSQSNDLHIAKVIALIDEDGVRHQLEER